MAAHLHVILLEEIMGEFLFEKWLEECIIDLPAALVSGGVRGLLADFERWLETNGHIHFPEDVK